MELEQIIQKITLIAEDAENSDGCSHEDVLQDSLECIAKDLQMLVKEIKKSHKL
jgi:hypothetical protein